MKSRFWNISDWPMVVKLAALVVLATVTPLILVTGHNSAAARAEMIASARTQNLQRARATARALDTYLNDRLADMDFLAVAPGSVTLVGGRADARANTNSNAALVNMRETHGYDAVYLTDLQGLVLAASDDRFLTRHYASAQWLQNAIAGQTAFDEPRFDPDDNQVYLHFSAPVRDAQKRIAGAIVGRIPLADIDRIITADLDYARPGDYGVLFDDQGIRLSQSSRPDLRFRPLAPLSVDDARNLLHTERFGPETEEIVRQPDQWQELVVRSRDLLAHREADPILNLASPGSGPEQVALAPLGPKRWIYSIHTPESSLMGPIDTEFRTSLVAALVAGVLAIIAAFVGTQWITHDVRTIVDTANALAAGDMTRRVRLPQRDEIGRLGAAFDTMADVLAHKNNQLHGYAAELKSRVQERTRQVAAANQMGRGILETLDFDEIFERLAQATLELLPETCTVYVSLYDARRQIITCAYGIQDGEILNTTDLPPIPLEPPGVGTQSEAIHTRQAVIIGNLAERLTRVRTVVMCGTPGPSTRSGLYVPMLAHDKVIGVVQAQCYLADRYSNADAELLGLVANTAAVAVENARLFAETRRRLGRVQALRAIDRSISESMDIEQTLDVVLQQITDQLKVDAAALLVLDRHLNHLEYVAWSGFRSRALGRKPLRMDEGFAGHAARSRKTVHIGPGTTNPEGTLDAGYPGEGFVTYYGVPLVAKGIVKGVLEICHRSPLFPDTEWLEFLDMLASQASVAIDGAESFAALQHSNRELALAYDTTLEGWSHALDLRDKETEGHTQRVTELTERLARSLGLGEEELVHIRRGALLHDIGKMGIPDNILLKPGTLTDGEWQIMRRHPDFAYELISPIAYLRPALEIPYCHHEKWDGTGYPRGLQGEQIPLSARLFAVVDVWDALLSDRPYRKGWPPDKVREYIASQAGLHFDPTVVAAFLKLDPNLPSGD